MASGKPTQPPPTGATPTAPSTDASTTTPYKTGDAELDKMLSEMSIVRDTRTKTEDVLSNSGVEFTHFGLKKDLLLGIYKKGFEKPSPIQEDSIPRFIKGENFIARAKNGTGKTAAYLIPMLQKIDTSIKTVQGIILVPTRELAMQVSSTAKELGQFLKVQVVMSTGGPHIQEDILRFQQTVHLAVCTPGRLADLARRNMVPLAACKMLVLDEADKMLSPEFAPAIEEIIDMLPVDKQFCLFSATFPKSVKSFCDRYLGKYGLLNRMDELTLKGVTQYYAFVDEKQKVKCLTTLFSRLNVNQSIIFCNSVVRVELLAKKITDVGAECLFIHSRMEQKDRNKVFHDFRSGLSRHLVCSDLITRGIDVLGVNLVVNFDFPKSSETYLHRIGRSGRFGHLGLAINLVTQADVEDFHRIEKELGVTIGPIPTEVPSELYAMASASS